MGKDVILQVEGPIVSVVIPCFNSGQYLAEAIMSVEAYSDKQVYEIIIINDGSTDQETNDLLNKLEGRGYKVIHQVNKGPAAARNAGVRDSKGKYILFLDSDNKIRPAFIDMGIGKLNQYPEVGIVHGRAAYFGESTTSRFEPRPYNLYNILAHNYIDMCSMVRKEVLVELGGLDEERVLIGHEDWEFWIRVGASNWKFYFVDQVLFDYRIGAGSLVTQMNHGAKYSSMRKYVYQKHWELFANSYEVLNESYHVYERDKGKPFRSFMKYLYSKVKKWI